MYSKLVSLIKEKPLKFVFLVFALLVVKELIYIQTFRNDVSPIADGFSEANTIRGGVFFYEQGLNKYKGLPDIVYGDMLPHRGTKGYETKTLEVLPPKAYTHYPPGPEYLAWLGFNIVGVGNFNALRFLPIILSILAGILFIRTNYFLFNGGLKGALFVLSLILVPMYSNFMHGLHHQQYAFLFFQIQISVALLLINSKNSKLILIFSLFILGFIQGYLTFDYAFLATLFVIPLYIFFNSGIKSLLIIGFASGLSFTLAHILHFYQVVWFYGDTQKAIQDFVGSAAHRAHNAANELDKPITKYDSTKIGPFTVLRDYLYRVAGRGKYLSINLMNFIWIVIALKFTKRVTLKKGWTFEFEVTGRDLVALFSAILISGLWSIVMKQHAHIHGFIARHYFLTYYMCSLILFTRTKKL